MLFSPWNMMKDEVDPNFVYSSTDKMLSVIVDINPTRTNHQHQNTVITFLSVTSSIHQLSRRKTRRRISRCHGDAKQARESRPYFRVLPEIVVDCGESSPTIQFELRRRRRRRRRRKHASPSWIGIRRRKIGFPPIRARGTDATSWARLRSGGRLPLPAKTGSNPMRVPQRLLRHGNNKNSSLVSQYKSAMKKRAKRGCYTRRNRRTVMTQ